MSFGSMRPTTHYQYCVRLSEWKQQQYGMVEVLTPTLAIKQILVDIWKVLLTMICFSWAGFSHAWQTTAQNTAHGQVYAAWKASTMDSSVSLVVSCIQNQRNATVTISTGNLVVGLANHTEHVVFNVGRGRTDGKGAGLSSVYARIREDGMGFYVGEGQQGVSMRAMIANNDWMKVYWQFVAPNRGKLLNSFLVNPPVNRKEPTRSTFAALLSPHSKWQRLVAGK